MLFESMRKSILYYVPNALLRIYNNNWLARLSVAGKRLMNPTVTRANISVATYCVIEKAKANNLREIKYVMSHFDSLSKSNFDIEHKIPSKFAKRKVG